MMSSSILSDLFKKVTNDKDSPYNKLFDVLNKLNSKDKQVFLSYLHLNLDYEFINDFCKQVHDQIRLGLEEKSPKSKWIQYEAEFKEIEKLEKEFYLIQQEVELQLQNESLKVKEESKDEKTEAKHLIINWRLIQQREFIQELHADLYNHGFINLSYDEFYNHFNKSWNQSKILWLRNIKLAVALFHIISEIKGYIDSKPSHQFIYDHFYTEEKPELNFDTLKVNRTEINVEWRKAKGNLDEFKGINIKGIDTIIQLIAKYTVKFPI